MAKTKRFAQWRGSNTEHAELPGQLLDGCKFIGIPFAGGMSEVPYFTARQIRVSDLHRHVINLCMIVKEDYNRSEIVRELGSFPYHPDILARCQKAAREWDWERDGFPSVNAALAYFVCVWMGLGGQAGTDKELTGKLPVRRNANGGGSNRRYRTAIEALDAWGEAFRRCEFVCQDAFEFLEPAKKRGDDGWQDVEGHGLFVDANWPDVGDGYTHAIDADGQERLAAILTALENTRVVVRYGEHPLIRRLYPEQVWRWIPLESRNQANVRKPEFLIVNFEHAAGIPKKENRT